MVQSLNESGFTVKKKRGNASRHQWIENHLHQSPQMTLNLEVTSHDGPNVEFGGKIWLLVVSGFVMIWNEGHVWMPQSWKQGQVWFIPKNDKPQTIGDAQLITLLNAHHNMHSHMVALWLRDSKTTLCLASQCAFIASTDITLSLSILFVNLFPCFSFSLKLYWQHRLNSETSSNCKLQKFSKSFAIRGMWTVNR